MQIPQPIADQLGRIEEKIDDLLGLKPARATAITSDAPPVPGSETEKIIAIKTLCDARGMLYVASLTSGPNISANGRSKVEAVVTLILANPSVFHISIDGIGEGPGDWPARRM